MMFDDAVQQALSVKNKAETAIVKLGTVTSVSNGRALVQHYGESTPSTKKYTAIDGYFPEVGDKVAMLPQGNTYIIIGKVLDSAPVEKYAFKTYVDDTFLPLEYKDKLEGSGGETVTLSGTSLVPKTNNHDDIGSSSKMFKQIFVDAVVGAKSQYSSGSSNNVAWDSTTDILPNNNNTVNLGSSSKQMNKVYTKSLYINGTEFSPSGLTVDKLHATYSGANRDLTLTADSNGMYLTPNVNNYLTIGKSNYKIKELVCSEWNGGGRSIKYDSTNAAFYPDTDNVVSFGTSTYQYKNIYGKNIYVNGTAVSSDRRKKKDIEPLDERYEEFFKALRPVSFEYKEIPGKHTGFIAQEVEEAAEEAGIDKDIAVVVEPESGDYYLRYEELIAVQTKMIQELMQKVENLEARIKKLEAKGEN